MPAASTPPQLIPAIDTRKSRRSNSHTKHHRHPAPPHPASWPESSLRSPLRAIAAMRRPVLIFLIFNLALVAFLVHSVWTLLELLVIDGVEDAITKAELPPMGEEHGQVTRPMIPKIIHQTYINTSIPLVWQDAQRSCLELHKEPEWKYMLWTDAMSDDFIKKEYPDFLDTFRGYQYPIQRADAIRYFVLEHFGGIYIDLDDGCNRSLEPLLKYPAFVRKTIPTGVSNDAMGSVPGHPFFQRVIEELPNYDRSWILPYISVMASTGPLFVSIIWRHYSDEGFNVGDGPSGGRVRIIFPQEYQNQPWSFFTHHLGNSWHGYDVQLIFWLARNWVLVTIFGFVLGFGLIFFAWWYYHRYYLTPSEIPRWKTKSIRQRLPFWSRRAQSEYELINRHEP